ncbi:MAG TPA: hypothetical protein VG838_16820 [Opitutaceae bacterium]|nr:hypothetical protein [Opitutaceae bacterium]
MRARLFLLLPVAIAGAGCTGTPVEEATSASFEQQAETKIRLMADALTARDHGDLGTAREKLETLQAMAPNDPTVRRILADVVAKLTAPPPAPAPEPVVRAPIKPKPAPAPPEAPAPAPLPGQVVMPVVRDEKSDAPEAPPRERISPEAKAAAAATEALLHADDTPLGKVTTYVEAQRALARTQAAAKNYAAAIATLDAALDELQRPVEELRAERRDYAQREKADAAAEERSRTGVRLNHHR